MATTLKSVVLIAIVAIAAALQGSTAQTIHVVGDALGWLVPPSTDVYATWAANQSFRAGDILVFNFVSGRHDVAQVTKAAFDACNTSTSPISRETNSPANITLSASGEHYYICTFPGHCTGGQKLAINVSSAASSPSPAPQPTTPSPVSSPTSPPSRSQSPTSTPTPAPASPPTPSSATPPSTVANPPSTTSTPAAPSPTGVGSPPDQTGSAAKSLHAAAGLSASFFAIIVVGLLY